MADHLERTSRYFDGELPEAEHEEIIAHLATCVECQQLLGAAVSLDAGVSTETRKQRRWWLVAAPAIAAAAAVAIWFAVKPSPTAAPAQLALAPARAVEPRFSGDLFAPHRPRAVMRGAAAHEQISLATLAELEQRGDSRDLIAALASSGDLPRAEQLAAKGNDTDRAAVALLAGKPEQALAYAYADTTPAGAWNLGLAARDLGLPHVAAAAFARVDDAGWRDEAKTLVQPVPDYAAAQQAGATMLAGGPLIDAAVFPAYARVELYDGIRTARSRDEVERYRPLAIQLDAVAALDRVAALDFAVRSPFVDDYKALIARTLPPDKIDALLTKLKSTGAPVADIYLGAAILAGKSGERAGELRAIAAGDPWFELFLERERIKLAFPAGDLRAEPALVQALERCGEPKWAMRCGALEQDLAVLLAASGRDDTAEPHARAAVAAFERAAMPPLLANARSLLADLHRMHGRFALARAEMEEVVLVATDPKLKHYAEVDRASVAFAQRDLAATRALLPAPDTDLTGLVTAVDLARMSRDAKDKEVAQAWITAAPDELLALTAKARLDDRQITPLHARAKAPATTAGEQSSRTWAYQTLIASAANHKAWGAVLALAGEEQPYADAPCVLVASSDDDNLSLAAKTPNDLIGATGTLVEGQPIVPKALVAALSTCTGIAVVARAPLHGRDDLLPIQLPWWFAGDLRDAAPAKTARAVQVFDAHPPDASLPALPALAPSKEPFEVSVSGADATPNHVLQALANASYAEIHAHGIVAAADRGAAYLALSPDPSGVYALRADAIRSAKLAGPIVVLAACRAAQVAPLQRERWSLPDAFLAAGARGVVAASVDIADAEARAVFDDLHHRITAGEPVAQALAAVRVAHPGWAKHLLLFQ